MRMRKKKNGAARLSACGRYLLEKPDAPLTDPAAVFGRKGGPVWLEIGAGKGGFALRMSERHPEVSYFALERVSDCLLLGAEYLKAHSDGRADNLRFLVANADDLADWFAPATADCIFLNFSDPWPKKGYAKRRLMHRRYLALYFRLLRDGGMLQFKTDNAGLFDFSLEELAAAGLTPSVVTRDLHASEYAAENIMTEYEKNFSEQGMPIHMLRVEKPAGFSLPLPDTATCPTENKP